MADITGCFAVPFQILPAPGAGLIISVLSITFQLTVAGVAYSIPGSTNNLGFQYNNNTHLAGWLVAVPIQGQSFNSVTNQKLGYSIPATSGTLSTFGGGIGQSRGVNQGIYMSSDNIISGGTGSGNSFVTLTYSIINVGL